MKDETPKTDPKPKTLKVDAKRVSKGYRKYLRRQKQAASKPSATG